MGVAVYFNPAIWDAGLNVVADNCNKMFFCSDEPTTYAEASTTHNVATHDLTVGVGNGDYTLGNGTPSGRALAVAASDGIEVDATETITHIALGKSVGTVLYAVHELTEEEQFAVTEGKLINIGAQSIRLDIGTVPEPE